MSRGPCPHTHATTTDADVRRGQQSQDRFGQYRFARARFSNDAQDFLGQDLERDTVNSEWPISPRRERYAEVFNREDRVAHRSRSLGLSASLRPSPTRLIARTVRRIATPGTVTSHQASLRKGSSDRSHIRAIPHRPWP